MARSKFDGKTPLRSLVLCLLFMSCALSLRAQLGPLSDPASAPQAKSPEELDAYLEIVSETLPQKTVSDVDLFAAQFPGSNLLGVAYQYQMHAMQRLGNFDGMLTAGQKALIANPDNLNTLLTLAPAIANGAAHRTNRTELLALAEGYAQRALTNIDRVRPPRKIPLEQWDSEKRSMKCSMHETLGVIALDRGVADVAVREFETATNLASSPDGARFFRLGVAYASDGNPDNAKASFQRAIELGPEPVRRLASEHLKAIGR